MSARLPSNDNGEGILPPEAKVYAFSDAGRRMMAALGLTPAQSATADTEEALATEAFELAGHDWQKAVSLLTGAAEMLRIAWRDDDGSMPF